MGFTRGGTGRLSKYLPDEVRVLLVDDEPGFAEMVGVHLEREKDAIETVSATSVDEAMTLLDETAVDVVVSDYEMPGTDGLEFLDAVREMHPGLPFILYTGKGSEEIASKAISRGVTDYLQKGSRETYELLANRIEHAVARGQAERAAERRERRLERLLQGSSDIITVVDGFGVVQYASPSMERFLGYDPDEVVGENVFDYLHPDDREHVMETFFDAVENPEQLPSAEYRFRHADGGWRWLESRGSDRIEQPDLTGFIVNARDVTERKERERDLEFFETLVETVADGVYALDEAGRYTYVNSHVEAVTGYDREEIVGETAAKFISDDAIDEFEDAVAEMLAGERETFETDVEVRTAEGETVPTAIKQTVLTADGEFRASVGVLRTIRERKERERELERYETMVDLSGDPIYTLDPDGRITFVSEGTRDLSGYGPDELVGEPATTVMDEEDIERGTELIREILADDGRTSGTFEMELVTKSGERVPCENHVALLGGDAESFRGTVGILRDISEQKEREQQLARQNEHLEEFTSMVSHDLRSPLNVAAGRLDLVRAECDSDHLDDVEAALGRMEHLIEDLLDLAKQGREVREPDPVDLGAVVDSVGSIVTGRDALRNETHGTTILADRDRLAQVLENLFRNSIEHSSGPVTVRVGLLDDGAGFYVEDDGPGIPADESEAVFDRGFSTSEGGTGFGLFIVRRIAEAHGWDVAVTEGRDGGARFEVRGVEEALSPNRI